MSASPVGARGSLERGAQRSPVGRAASLALWQAAPWVLAVLVLPSLLGGGLAAWAAWRGGQGGASIVEGDGGLAGAVSVLVGVATLFSWAQTVPTVVPVLVAGGTTRRAAVGGLLVGTVALALVTTALLTVVAVTGTVLRRVLATRSGAVLDSTVPSSLTIAGDAPQACFNPVETFSWLVLAALAGALLGAARYRWRVRGVVAVMVVAGCAWSAWVSVTAGADAATARAVGTAGPSLLVGVGPPPALAVAVWLVLRHVPLRPPAR